MPTGAWQYNFTSEWGQPLYNSKIIPKVAGYLKCLLFRGSTVFSSVLLSGEDITKEEAAGMAFHCYKFSKTSKIPSGCSMTKTSETAKESANGRVTIITSHSAAMSSWIVDHRFQVEKENCRKPVEGWYLLYLHACQYTHRYQCQSSPKMDLPSNSNIHRIISSVH